MGVDSARQFWGANNNCKSTPAQWCTYLVEEVEPLAEREKKKKSQLFNLETHFSFIITFQRVQRLSPRDVGRNC